MKILLLGEYDPDEIVIAPIKVGKELFSEIKNSEHQIIYMPYFQDGNIYSRWQKLFGFQKINDGIFRTGIFYFIKFVIRFKPDIVQINPGLYYAILFPFKGLLQIKIVSTLHSINRYVFHNLSDIKGYKKHRFLLIEWLLVKCSDCLFVYSQRDKRYVARYYNIPRSKISVVRNGVKNFNIKKEEFSSQSLFKAAFVGDVNRKEKDFDLLFNALSKLQLPVQLSIYNFQSQSDTTKYISNNIRLKVFNPLNEVSLRNELIKNDLFIQPSIIDSFPLSLLEAMNAGVIFLISNRIGLVELLSPMFEELIFPKSNSEMLISKIKYILSLSEEQKRDLSIRISKFSESFSWENIYKDYLKSYNNILNC